MSLQFSNAPWTEQELELLKQYQHGHLFRPYLCCFTEIMEPTKDGLICPKCGKIQTWTYTFSIQENPGKCVKP